jgi:transcriptional antiterminator Rof (Rho-off)
MEGLQSVYNQIINILKENNVLINITHPRPYLIKKDDEERINAEAEDLFKKYKEEYNSKMKEKEAYKLYLDEAYKYTNFYEDGDE